MTVSELADPGNYYFWIITTGIAIAIIGLLKGKIQMLFTITSFAYPNAKYNAIGNDYVKKHELEALIEARSFQDAVGILATRDYAVKEAKNTKDSEKILNEHNIKTLEDILQDIPAGLHPLIKAYMKKYEVGILKRLLKSRLSFRGGLGVGGGAGTAAGTAAGIGAAAGKGKRGKTAEAQQVTGLRPIGDITLEILQQLQDTERADEIAELFSKTPFGKELREAIHEYDGNFQKIENILDKYVYQELRKADENVAGTVAVPTRFFVNHLLDIANIKMLLRAKRNRFDSETCKNMLYPHGLVLSTWKLEQMCEASNVTELVTELEGTKYYPIVKDLISTYEKTGDVSPLEVALDKYFLRLVVEIAIQYTTTAGPTIRYMVSREFEIRNLKSVLHGLEENLDHKRIMPLVITEEEE